MAETVPHSRELRVSLGGGVDLVGTDFGVRVESTPDLDKAVRDRLVTAAGEVIAAYRRGAAVLHGSCVRWFGHGLSFVGPQAEGKSTLTAWLATQGAELVSDGATIVDPDTGQLVWRRPAWRLSDDSAEFLGHHAQSLPFDDPSRSKRMLAAPRGREDPAIELRVVFALEEGPSVEVVSLSPMDQVVALMRDWHLVGGLPASEAPVLLERASRLLRAGVRVVRLVRPKEWTVFPAVAAALRRYLERQSV
ncbi:MAG: hypothetical protein JW940_07815 [Polyangiaceae bacterium]|nr:hypothetical protein [Polyangiaceae bacterium]